MQKIIDLINRLSEYTGRALSWLVLVMVLVTVADISLRYFFRLSSGAVQELVWHLFALIFLIGAAYTLKHDAHVRVDIFYRSKLLDARKRAWVDVMGVLFMLIPMCLFVIIYSLPIVASSFASGEGSPDAGGLPYRFLLKSAIPVGFFLLLLQGLAELLKNILFLQGKMPERELTDDNPSSACPPPHFNERQNRFQDRQHSKDREA